jgi:hypothetical protein
MTERGKAGPPIQKLQSGCVWALGLLHGFVVNLPFAAGREGVPAAFPCAGKWMILLALASMAASLPASEADAAKEAARRANRPPRVAQAERFLAKRGWQPGLRARSRIGQRLKAASPESTTSNTVTWQSLVTSLVTGEFRRWRWTPRMRPATGFMWVQPGAEYGSGAERRDVNVSSHCVYAADGHVLDTGAAKLPAAGPWTLRSALAR